MDFNDSILQYHNNYCFFLLFLDYLFKSYAGVISLASLFCRKLKLLVISSGSIVIVIWSKGNFKYNHFNSSKLSVAPPPPPHPYLI